MVFVHGDDFVSSGEEESILWFKKLLENRYPIKTTILGEDKKYEQYAIILNRILRWHPG